MAALPELLEKNLKALERSQPKLAARLRETAQGLERFPEPVISETSAGRWISGLTERPFFEPSLEETSRPKLAKGAVYLVHGAGCPPYLFHILRALPRDALAVIVVEPSVPVLLNTLAATSVFMALPKGCRISFIVFEDRPLIDEAFEHNVIPLGIYPISDAVSLVHKGLEENRSDLERAVIKMFREEVIYRLTLLGNSPEDTLLGLRHGALNTLRILRSPSFGQLKEQLLGKPFVSVASGPSLEKNVDLLKGMQDKCVIVACDTVLLPLLRRGIRPHIVTTIERPLITYETWVPPVLDDFSEECKKILLLSQSVSHPLIAGRWPGPKIVVGKRESPADSWLVFNVLGKTLFISGMSVSHMNLSLALAMDASAVALIGQDLAFAEDQRTHVAGAVPADIAAFDGAMERIEVPGALGGVVQTHKYWLNFLQIFERYISAFGDVAKICDCTEGGALIRGAEVLPFRSFLDREVLSRPTFIWVPENVTAKNPDNEEKLALDSRIENAFQALAHCDEYLDKMEHDIATAVAPALPPARRQEAAFRVAGFLDDCHAHHPVLSFIGQSYTHLAGASIARNRFMETPEQVQEWRNIHEDIVRSHRASVSFLRQWLGYIQKIASDPLEDTNIVDVLLSQALESFFSKDPTVMASEEALRISEMLCRLDLAVGDEHDPQMSWRSARFLFAQGRASEACRIMRSVYEKMEGSEQSTALIGTFFLDWARMEGTPDLCETAKHERALELAANAISADPSLEPACVRLREELLTGQSVLYARYRDLDEKNILGTSVLEFRNRAALALSREQLPDAFEWIWKIVELTLEADSRLSLPNAKWLLETALKCRNAVDPAIAKASFDVLNRIWGRRADLERAGFRWPEAMMEFLDESGLQVFLQGADTDEETDAIDGGGRKTERD